MLLFTYSTKEVIYQLSIILTEKCNLNCAYCYCDKSKSNSISSEKAIESIDQFILQQPEESAIFNILFIGGEPFMEFSLMKEIVNHTLQTYPHRKVNFKAVTNGTLIHGEVQQWLIENQKHFSVELSLDGEAESQNKERCNTYNKIDIDFFSKGLKQAIVNKVISPENIHTLANDIIALEQQGFYVKAVIADGVEWSKEKDIDTFSLQLKALIDHYLTHPKQVPFNLLSNALYCLTNSPNTLTKCQAGSSSYSIDTNGDKLPCHRCSDYYNNGDWKIPQEQISLLATDALSSKCKECLVFPICSSCPASIASKLNNTEQCEAYCLMMKSLFHANAYFIVQMLLNCPDHIYFENRPKDQIAASYAGAKKIFAQLDSTQPF
ncbi:4Fe-4S cluster-binding domain-containing protein [Prolixibacteraceae bacterium JC049]|nr:4Fe-4S cluster-binding domain-containing protein [Prolixibacteraceae bacterium JC049]